MNYLARLAAQTGLMELTGPQSQMPLPVSAGFDVVDEIEVTASAGPAIAAAAVSDGGYEVLRMPPEVNKERIVEEVTLDPPRMPAKPVASPPATAPPVKTAEGPVAPPSPPTPEKDAATALEQPEGLRELRLRQVMEWVAQNDRPEAVAASSDLAEDVAPERREAPAPPAPVPQPEKLPELEITSPRPTLRPEPPVPRQPADKAPDHGPLMDRRPQVARPTTESVVIEEHIDISIGTIRLEVRPPVSVAGGTRMPAPPSPQPLPLSAGPAPSASRLRRRYIRM